MQFVSKDNGSDLVHKKLKPHMKAIEKDSRHLARAIFVAMLKHRDKLDREHVLLGRLVDIGTELFTMSTTCARAQYDFAQTKSEDALELAHVYCQHSRVTLKAKFSELGHRGDKTAYALAQKILSGAMPSLFSGITQERNPKKSTSTDASTPENNLARG